MECPNCHQNASRVIDSRPSDENRAIRRRRECENCGFRFTTFERVETARYWLLKMMEQENHLVEKKSCMALWLLVKRDLLPVNNLNA